ncbi:MAG: porin family protein [Cyclobacteriaceae bacterium]
MKKTILTLSLSLIALIGFSQAKMEIGVKAGANFANTSLDDSESITSLHGGAYALFKLSKLGIQPELLFSKQGSEFSGGGEVDLSYVNIPVMVKLYLAGGLNLQAGPQFGILTTAEDGDGDDLKDQLKGSDVSAAIGAGFDAPFGLQVTARYVIGLSDINDFPGSTDDFKNKTFQISVGYSLFKLGK